MSSLKLRKGENVTRRYEVLQAPVAFEVLVGAWGAKYGGSVHKIQ